MIIIYKKMKKISVFKVIIMYNHKIKIKYRIHKFIKLKIKVSLMIFQFIMQLIIGKN